jgi:hypothetical protein
MLTWKRLLPLLLLAGAALGVPLSLGCSARLEGFVVQADAIPPAPEPGDDRDVPLAATIVVSGTVTGPGGVPAENVLLIVASPLDGQQTATNASGFYSVTLQAGDAVSFRVRPAISSGLGQVNFWVNGVTGSFTQDIALKEGHLLSLRPTGIGGAPVTGDLGYDIQSLIDLLADGEWYELEFGETAGRYQAMLPEDVYYVTVGRPPSGYYRTTQAFDLRTSDVTADLPLNTEYVNPMPYDPPDAAKITIGAIDGLGEAAVTGSAGAALPFAEILVVNLSSFHQAYATSEADGSFGARIFAPPGSSIMIKHGPPGPLWWSLYSGVAAAPPVYAFPGTILYVPHAHEGQAGGIPFGLTGPVSYFVDDFIETRNYVGAAWAITGTLGPTARYAAGDSIWIRGTLRLYSPAITATTDVGAIGGFGVASLQLAFTQQGHPVAGAGTYMSTMLTPSGFPIQGGGSPSRSLPRVVEVTNLRYLGEHIVEGDLAFDSTLPADLAAGIYQPGFMFHFTGVPTDTQWLAAWVKPSAEVPTLPPITVGEVEPPRLIWRLLNNDAVQGTRGAGAREDRGLFGLASDIVFQDAPYHVPPVDLLVGQPITYRLEPFLPMFSHTDRRMPVPPLIPLDLPGGMLEVLVQGPDGTPRYLGAEPFAQSFNRTKTTRYGGELNAGTIQMDDAYSLKAASDRFRVTFDQYGHHAITMIGSVDDVWGNSYTGGGTYDLWVARELDMDPGVLPGTPLAVDDLFNPTVQFYPRVPAEVELVLTLYPDSNPALAQVHVRSGRANPYGYFSLVDPIPVGAPGEYRVDLTAFYTAADGTLYMGAMTWGGVVMTPQVDAGLKAHGRRGLDSLVEIPNPWFVSCRDLTIDPSKVSHTMNPYFTGDLIWSRMPDATGECPAGTISGGDSLVLAASVQDVIDPEGPLATAILDRAARMRVEIAQPGTITDRAAAGELPLLISTRSGYPPQLVLGQIGEIIPPDVDQIAYAYGVSQRPGVRVREYVAQDLLVGGYWRLDTLYDNQLGVGTEGDRANDFKFQYLGVVYRDLDSGRNEYLGQGTGWIFIPDEDPTGSRVMPPFAGYGGWTAEGGPLLTLKGQAIHVFILPTGTRPGAVLELGEPFRFAGHIMPTLDSKVAFTATSPSHVLHTGVGQANAIGYYYDLADDFVVDEPGLWSVDVRVWHDGQIGSGDVMPCASDPSMPCPSGDVLGSTNGRYWFYVVPPQSPRLSVATPVPGFLSFDDGVQPITVTGSVPAGLSGATIDYTIGMAGFILEHGQVTPGGGRYQIVFDPVALNRDFPNLDLVGRESIEDAGLADTFSIGLLLCGQSGGEPVYRANAITIQGAEVFVDSPASGPSTIYLPVLLRSYAPRQ